MNSDLGKIVFYGCLLIVVMVVALLIGDAVRFQTVRDYNVSIVLDEGSVVTATYLITSDNIITITFSSESVFLVKVEDEMEYDSDRGEEGEYTRTVYMKSGESLKLTKAGGNFVVMNVQGSRPVEVVVQHPSFSLLTPHLLVAFLAVVALIMARFILFVRYG